jgi:hypothetical protein
MIDQAERSAPRESSPIHPPSFWWEVSGGARQGYDVENPATEEVIATVADATPCRGTQAPVPELNRQTKDDARRAR